MPPPIKRPITYVASKVAAWSFWHLPNSTDSMKCGAQAHVRGKYAASYRLPSGGAKSQRFDMTPGEQWRDFVYISDVITAPQAARRHPALRPDLRYRHGCGPAGQDRRAQVLKSRKPRQYVPLTIVQQEMGIDFAPRCAPISVGKRTFGWKKALSGRSKIAPDNRSA
jgi:hypothetical protein